MTNPELREAATDSRAGDFVNRRKAKGSVNRPDERFRPLHLNPWLKFPFPPPLGSPGTVRPTDRGCREMLPEDLRDIRPDERIIQIPRRTLVLARPDIPPKV